jgi:hypothetical protein
MPTPTRRYYSSTAVAGTLTATLTSVATSMVVSTVTGWPGSFPYTVIIGEDTASEELVTVTAGSTTTLTITRGVGGTSAQAHGVGETVRHGIYSQDFEDGAAHYAASTAVHGVAGSVVGNSDTQTLTNKTISGASNTLSSIPSASVAGVDSHIAATAVHGATGAVVGTTNTQTLTNKTISGASNTLSAIPSASVTGLDTHIAATAVHGITGAVVGTTDTQTLTNKTISGTSNTLSDIPQASIVGVSGTLVSTDTTQTLTNKTISGASNTLSAIPASAVAQTAWTAYTPTWIATTTSPSVGNGTLTGAYIRIGNTIHYRIRLRFGSTTNRGDGSYRFTLPVPTIATDTSGGDYVGHGLIWDNSLADRYARSLYTHDASTIGFASEVSSSVTHSSPALWAVSDGFSISGTYEAA